jgi:hypothetical protein
MPQSIGALGDELMKRELARDPEQFNAARPKFDLGLQSGPSISPIDPHRLATIGGLADAASTYYFLKRGTGREGNAMMGFANNNPEMTALGALGGLAASKGVTSLIKRFSPRAADAIAANLGALQSAYAVSNLDPSRRSSQAYQNAMTNKVIKGQ